MKVISLIALQCLRGIGSKTTLAVANDIPCDPAEFANYVSSKFGRPSQEAEYAWDQALRIMDKCQKSDIYPVAVTDEYYPNRLHTIQEDRPPVIYIKGSLEAIPNSSLVVAIVGTRKPTDRGIEAAYEFGCMAAKNNVPVVSGLAYGCDYYGHSGCLEQGGTAIAILAHGLDMVYPSEHRDMANQIVEEGGCLMSEYQPGQLATRWSFVARDRLQSALSDIVIVIQTGKNGGTHHTAKFAQAQKRKILCVRPRESDLAYSQVWGNSDIVHGRGADWIDKADDLLPLIRGWNWDHPELYHTNQQLGFDY